MSSLMKMLLTIKTTEEMILLRISKSKIGKELKQLATLWEKESSNVITIKPEQYL